jgi:hypothetical protein
MQDLALDTIYYDHAGDLDFSQGDGEINPVVACAVYVPSVQKSSVLDTLPKRCSDGELLKFSSGEVGEEALFEFTRSILELDVDISILTIDSASKESAELLSDLLESSNQLRQSKGVRKTTL